MAKVEHTSDAHVLVGIDISKHRHEVLIAVPGKTRRRRLTITNSTDDFMRLIAILQEYGLPVRVGFEATGNYHRVLMYRLGVAGFDLKLVSSVALARTREALHNSWDKNDPKDAQVILHMLQIGAVQIFQDPMVAGTNDIQELSKTHDAVSRSKTELWHRILTHYLPLYFPEVDRFHRSSRTDWFLAFLEMFPSPHMISAMTKEEFTTAAWEVVGRKVEKSLLLSDIYETAKVSAGLPVSPDSDAIRMFRLMLAEGRSLIRQRNAIEDRAVELLGERAPPLQRVHHAGRLGLAGRFATRLAACRIGHARHGASGSGGGLGRFLHARDHGVGGLELERVGHVAHVEVHALERGQRHLLHLQRLDGGLERHRVLVEPELHRLELLDALVQLLHVERGRHPVAKVGQLGNVLRRALGQVLQKVKTGDEFAETEVGGIAHGLLLWNLC